MEQTEYMKQKQDIVRSLAQNEEDAVLIASVLDKLETCMMRNYITNTRFLDIRQRAIVHRAVIEAGGKHQCVFWGGYDDAERVCAIFFPDYMTANDVCSEENSPIVLLRATKKPADNLTHRDYLGSIMGLQLNRDRIGDILVCSHGAEILVMQEVSDFIKMNLVQAGRKQISISQIPIKELIIPKQNQIEGSGSVASLRLDSIIALVFSLSRGDAQELIEKGMVFLNSEQCIKAGRDIDVGDRITVRTKGRCQISSLGGQSRKGRQFVNYIKTV